jgi:GH15 family glucan-1,4-alpha-glucosidase
MPLRIEDYAMIGDCHSAALVGRDGSIDWLCWPRFDSPACFAALLGTSENGRWLIAPVSASPKVSRRYLDDTLILETEFETETGTATLVDFMPGTDGKADLVRIVFGRSGEVKFHTELVIRLGYGELVPWVNRAEDGTVHAIGGPERLVLHTPVALYGQDLKTVGEFTVGAGQSVPFVLSYGPSFESAAPPIDAFKALETTAQFWRKWCSRCPDVRRPMPQRAGSLRLSRPPCPSVWAA